MHSILPHFSHMWSFPIFSKYRTNLLKKAVSFMRLFLLLFLILQSILTNDTWTRLFKYQIVQRLWWRATSREVYCQVLLPMVPNIAQREVCLVPNFYHPWKKRIFSILKIFAFKIFEYISSSCKYIVWRLLSILLHLSFLPSCLASS